MDKQIENKVYVGLYTVYDKLAVEAGPIYEAKNDAVAVRAYKNLLGQNKVTNPDEYQLVKVGVMNKTDLTLIPETTIINIEYGVKQEEGV